jgi:hypothetical protein
MDTLEEAAGNIQTNTDNNNELSKAAQQMMVNSVVTRQSRCMPLFIQDRYLFCEQGSDQLVGRCVSGLPILDERFATIPPHFSESILLQIVN